MADDRNRTAVKRQILALLRNHGDRAFRAKELAKLLDCRDQRRYQLFREALAELTDAGLVASVSGGRVQHKARQKENRAVGVIAMHPQGYAFVTLERGEEAFVPAGRVRNALHGDRVRVELAAPVRGGEPDRLRQAEVVEVLERGRTQTVGTFDRMGHFAFVKPDDLRLTRDIYVAEEDFNGATEGDKVVVSIDRFDDPKASPEGRVLEVIGPADAPGVAVLALAMAQGVKTDFPPEVERDTARIPVAIPEAEIARRLDLRGARIFTIDPVDAKDFDDAIHIKELPGGTLEVGVHIADVSAYVEEGTALDAEAYARGTSTYLVDRVIPMLPEKLSNGVCSLRPNEDKLTYSILLEVSPRGALKGWRIAETVIHSQARLTYEEAQSILDGEMEHPLAEDVRRAGRLAATLTKKRLRAGAIDFDMPEIRVVLGEQGEPVDIIRKERMPANRLIEEFMLLANRAAAEEVERRGLTSLYRVHDRPDGERIRKLADYVRAFGYQLPLDEGSVSPQALNDLLAHVKGTAEQPVIEQAALRAMAKAVYAPGNIGHYGLGFSAYTHFTSPIRRYPDLIVHRLLKRYLAGGKAASLEWLAEAGTHLSARERAAEEAERESVRLKQVEYVARHVGDTFDGVVTGVTAFGVFVELTPLLTEGLVHVRDMDDDYWEYDERAYALVGSRSRRMIRMGDPVRVQVAAADPETRRIDLVFAKDEPAGETNGRPRATDGRTNAPSKSRSATPEKASGGDGRSSGPAAKRKTAARTVGRKKGAKGRPEGGAKARRKR